MHENKTETKKQNANNQKKTTKKQQKTGKIQWNFKCEWNCEPNFGMAVKWIWVIGLEGLLSTLL